MNGYAVSFILKLLGMFIALALDKTLLNVFGVSDSAELFVFLSIVLVSGSLSRMGAEPYIVDRLARLDGRPSLGEALLYHSVILVIISSCIIFLVLFCIAQIGDGESLFSTVVSKYKFGLLCSMIFTSLTCLLGCFFQSKKNIILFNASQFTLLNVFVLLITIALSPTMMDFSKIYVFCSAAIFFLTLFVVRYFYGFKKMSIGLHGRYLKLLAKKYLGYSQVVLSQMLILRCSVIFASFVFQKEEVSAVNVCLKISLAFGFITPVINAVFFPRASHLQKWNVQMFEREVKLVAVVIFAFTVLSLVLIFIFGKFVLGVFDASFMQYNSTLFLYCIAQSLIIAVGSLGYLFIVFGRGDLYRFQYLLGLGFFLIFLSVQFFLIQSINVIPISIGLAYALMFCYMMKRLGKILDFDVFPQNISDFGLRIQELCRLIFRKN